MIVSSSLDSVKILSMREYKSHFTKGDGVNNKIVVYPH